MFSLFSFGFAGVYRWSRKSNGKSISYGFDDFVGRRDEVLIAALAYVKKSA